MKDSIIADRLRRVSQLADNNLNKLDKALPERGKTEKLYTYLPEALQKARTDPQFAAQLMDSLEKFEALHGIVWGKAKK